MEALDILRYGGIGVIALLLIMFEFKEGYAGNGRTPKNSGYEYYSADGIAVKIRHVFGSLYKVYVSDYCPLPTKKDRFGTYFSIRARSASEAEFKVDSAFKSAHDTA